MDLRRAAISRSIFYRGISLKDYLRKSSLFHENLEYKDDQTILVDENKNPVVIENEFIRRQTEGPSSTPQISQIIHCEYMQKLNTQMCIPQGRSVKLPQSRHLYIPTERNSTQTSLGTTNQMRKHNLPSIQKQELSLISKIFNSPKIINKSLNFRSKVKKPTQNSLPSESLLSNYKKQERSHSIFQASKSNKRQQINKIYNISEQKIQTKVPNKNRYAYRLKSHVQ